MQGFISRFLELSHDLLVRIPAMSRAHTRVMDDNNARQTNAVAEVAAEALKKSSARERLDALSDYRISASTITFTSEKSGGSGGKADVVRARFKRRKWSRKQVVAVKKLRCGDAMRQPKVSREFAHEVGVMAGLAHENIVRFIGFVADLENGKAWIVLSWEPNGNVSEFLATGNWEIPERVSLIQDTFEGVKYLHTRQPPICHGDLKSFNILVSSSYRAIITDFGSARAITESDDGPLSQELDRQVQGNPTTEQAHPQIHVGAVGNQLTLTGPAWSLRWAPPEVVDGKHPSLSTDIWAGGWICWEVMTNNIPFHEVNSAGAITLMVVRGDVPAARDDTNLAQIIALCSLMKDCWEFDPKARPTIAKCCNELEWIPSIPPSCGNTSDREVPSIDLLFEMAKMHYDRNDLEKATSLFLEGLSLARSAGDQPQVARALNLLGRVYIGRSEYTQAEESFTRAQEIFARVGDDVGRATAFVGLGDLYRIQSKYTQAEEMFTRAQEIHIRFGNDLGRAKALDGVGQVYCCQSKYTQAEESYTQAQEICTRVGNDHGQANTLGNLGELYLLQSKYARAEKSYTRAQEIYSRLGDDHGQANTFIGIGNIYQLQSKYNQAEELFTRALEIYTRGGSGHGRANTLDGLGRIHCHQSKYTEAEERFTQAQEIYGRVGDDLGQAGSLFRLGQAYYVQSKYTEAEESYTRAQEIFTRMGDDQGRAGVLYGLGHLRQNQGRNMEAASYYAEAKDLYVQIGSTEDEEKAAHWLAVVSPEQNSSTP